MKTLTFATAIIALSSALSFAASHWPQFRGPNCQGIADESRPPVHFGPNTNLIWQTDVPSGVSSPCIWKDRIYLTAFDTERKKLETVCLDRQSGKVLWRRDVPTDEIEKVHEINNPANATPAASAKAVFVYFATYGLIGYDLNGAALWQKSLPPAKTFRGFGSGTSPVVIGDQLVLDVHLNEESHLLAVRCSDGETVWKIDKPLFNNGWSTPITWREDGQDVVGILNAGRFTAHDIKSGAERWWVTGIPNQICATPAVGGDVLFLSGTGVLGDRENVIPPPPFDELLAKYDANKDERLSMEEIPESILIADRKSSGAGNMTLRQMLSFGPGGKNKSFDREEWDKSRENVDKFLQGDMMKTCTLAVRTGGKGDVTETKVAWTEIKGVPEVPSPLLYRNRLYYVKNGGVLTCRDAATGRAVYEERLGAMGGYYASPVAANGKIYTASDRGVVTVIEAGDKFEVITRNDLKESLMATPAIVDGKLYIRTGSHLFAFGVK